MATPEPLSPAWWALRLWNRLRQRQPILDRYEDYYCGRHDLPDVPDQLKDEVRRFLELCRANYCGLVVQAPVERMSVVGFRVGDDDTADGTAWNIWQSSNLDALSVLAFTDMVKFGVSYLLVGPGEDDGDLPQITVESPSQCIVEYAPGSSRRRDAALKVWLDDRLSELNATLFLREEDGTIALFKWRGPKSSGPAAWKPRQTDEPGSVVDGAWRVEVPELRSIPMVELRNEGRSRSDLDDVIPVQDRLNLTLCDRLMTQTWGGFPQRYVSGWPLDESEFDEQGQPNPVQLDVGRSRLLRFPDGAQPGAFPVAPLEPYISAKTADVRDIASLKSIPTQYLLGDLVNVSAEGMQVAESGLISRVTLMQRFTEDGLEDAMSMALLLADDSRPQQNAIHTLWADPQYRSIAQQTDAVIKQFQAKLITLRVAQQKLGFSPQEIEDMAAELDARAGQSETAQLLNALSTTLPGGEPAAPAAAQGATA